MYYRPIRDVTLRLKALWGKNYYERQLALLNQSKQLELLNKYQFIQYN